MSAHETALAAFRDLASKDTAKTPRTDEDYVDVIVHTLTKRPPSPLETEPPLVDQVAAVICQKPYVAVDGLRVFRRYLDEAERDEWRAEAREIIAVLLAQGWTPPSEVHRG